MSYVATVTAVFIFLLLLVAKVVDKMLGDE
ncbi:MAG: hypothetical protein ACI8WT_000038 [Clostridium sp.]|jgi:hypothetical protein